MVERRRLRTGTPVHFVPRERAPRAARRRRFVDQADPVAVDEVRPLQEVTNSQRHAHDRDGTPTVASMRAVTIVDKKIEIREHPVPEPAKGELLVRVRAAGLNNADLMQVQGFYPAPPGSPPDIPGLELAGEVVGTGDGVTAFAEGDRVMAVVGGGA